MAGVQSKASLEKPLEYRQAQLQLMTPKKLKGHLDCLQSNIQTVFEKTGQPICPNMVTAMKEAEAELAKRGSHLDAAAMDKLRSAVKMEHRHAEPRVVESLAEALYFAQVQEEFESSYPELAATAQTAIKENEADRLRWEMAARAK
jgi:hypothetical protein